MKHPYTDPRVNVEKISSKGRRKVEKVDEEKQSHPRMVLPVLAGRMPADHRQLLYEGQLRGQPDQRALELVLELQ